MTFAPVYWKNSLRMKDSCKSNIHKQWAECKHNKKYLISLVEVPCQISVSFIGTAECTSLGILSLTLSVLKKLPHITVFSEILPADEPCRMFSQQNKSNKNPKLFYLKRKFVSLFPVGLRNVCYGLSLTLLLLLRGQSKHQICRGSQALASLLRFLVILKISN